MVDDRNKPIPGDLPRANLAPKQSTPGTNVAFSTTDDVHSGSEAAPSTDAILTEGTKVARYLVLRQLGAGGMGVVYAAYDPELNRRVAIKLLHPKIMGDQDADQNRTRLIREAQAMARLSHPQVIAVHDIGTFGEQIFIAMDFVEGGTLKSWLHERPRSAKEILEKFVLAGRGLAAAHAAGLIHRDFKPDNVLIGKDGGVYVTDFGLARESKSTESAVEIMALLDTQKAAANALLNAQLTKTGALMGTPLYMAPEQYKGDPLDARTDEFSFCVALYEALYGSPPFAGNSLVALGFNVLTGKLEPIPRGASVPSWLRQVLLRGLRIVPEERYPSMVALLDVLTRDRQRARLSSILIVLTIGLVTLGLWGLRELLRRNEMLCQASTERLQGVWDDQIKKTIRSALLATGHRQAEATAGRVVAELDRYIEKWAAMRIDACAAMHIRGEQSAALLDLRMQCLDRRLQEVEALTQELRTVDRFTIERMVNARYDFTPIAVCANVTALRLPVPLPERPEVRAKVETLYRELAILKAQDFSGRYAEMMPRARTALDTAHAVGYGPVEAQASFILAKVELRNGLIANAQRDFERAAALALRSHDNTVLAQALTLIHHIVGISRSQYDQALVWQELAAGALDGAPDAERSRPQLITDSCVVAIGREQYSEAVQLCQQAIVLQEQFTGKESPEAAAYMNNLASVYRHAGQTEKALGEYRRALKILVQKSGSQHPLATMTLRNLAGLLNDSGQFPEAAARYNEALKLDEQRFGSEDPRLLEPLNAVSMAELRLGNIPQARASAERLLAIAEKAFGEKHAKTAAAYDMLARVLFEQGRFAESLSLRERMRPFHEQAKESEDLAENLIISANCLRELGKPGEALPLLERALRLLQPGMDTLLNPDAQFALARSLWALGKGKNRMRALAAAQLARTGYAQTGRVGNQRLLTVSEWLKQRSR